MNELYNYTLHILLDRQFYEKMLIGLVFLLLSLKRIQSLNKEQAIFQLNSLLSLNMDLLVKEFLFPDFHVLQDLRGFSTNYLRFQCSNLFEKQLKAMNSTIWPPPESIPDDLIPQFKLFNLVPIFQSYHAEGMVSGSYYWSNELINTYREREHSNCGVYHSPVCDLATETYRAVIKGKRGLVVGSLAPWAEAMLMNHGVAELITAEYTKIDTDYPRLTIITPFELAAMYLRGDWEPVDFIFTFSSLEHDGLGRYGDPINPWGDLQMMARLHCLLKDDGWLFFGVPTGRDTILWNSHRIYGRHRLRLLFQDWWYIEDFYRGMQGSNETLSLLLATEDVVDPTYRYEESMWVLRKARI